MPNLQVETGQLGDPLGHLRVRVDGAVEVVLIEESMSRREIHLDVDGSNSRARRRFRETARKEYPNQLEGVNLEGVLCPTGWPDRMTASNARSDSVAFMSSGLVPRFIEGFDPTDR